MKRDVLLTYTQGTNVTEQLHRNNSVDLISTQLPFADATSALDEGNQLPNETKLVGGKFYNSYNPEVGIHTAGVLGGILLVLVLYVIYRTKCRKRILRLFEKCTMKYFPEEFPKTVTNEQNKDDATVEESKWISESAKMIWKERANLSRDSDSFKQQTSLEQSDAGRLDSCRRKSSVFMQVDDNAEVECDTRPPKLPDSVENIEKATAYWVQNVKYMDIKERQLNGIILKIPPDLLSHSAKIRSHFHSVTDYGDVNEIVSISQRNKSLPSLIEQKTCVKLNYANIPNDRSSRKYVSIPTQEDDLDFDLHHSPLKVKHISGSNVPLDICPIVKVQHYHSRSKRRLTSLCHSSSDDDISTSSDEHYAPEKSLPNTGSDAKYKRLDTTECISAENCESSQKQTATITSVSETKANVPHTNNHSKRPVIRSLETNV